MHTLLFVDLKQVYFIRDQFLCKTTFQRTLVKNNFTKCSQLKITWTNYYPKKVLSNFSYLQLHFSRPVEVKNILMCNT